MLYEVITKSIGSDEDWDRATKALISALDDTKLPYEINEGDGAFYGPKIDIKLTDALDRRWQCATIQCDFTLPERFDLTYVGADGERHRVITSYSIHYTKLYDHGDLRGRPRPHHPGRDRR